MLKLPVIESVKDAIGYTMSNITLLVKASMFWVALYTILVAGFSFMGGDAFMQTIANFAANPVNENAADPLEGIMTLMDNLGSFGTTTNLLYLGMMLIGVVAYYSIAIAWHRACLLDEVPPLVRLGKLEFRYFGYTLLLGVGLYALFLLIGFLISFLIASFGSGDVLGITYLILALMSVIMFLAFGRFSLVFPGIAVRDRRMGFKTSWQATKDNSWRILGGFLLCVLPSFVISLIGSLLTSISLPLVIYMPIIMVLQLLSGAFLLSFMSICYQFLVPSPDEGDLA